MNRRSSKAMARWANDPRVESVEWEDGSYWVYLRAMWINGSSGAHVIHEFSIGEIDDALRMYVEACECDDCLIDQQEAAQ